ncbi:MAG: DNA polymerase III subunit delta' [Leptodesmis sp.]|uniref:DNA polymerase III subunit delta' n=1 Tax=Leptodesmis sp. TaxID=3100501 RepID=UPI003D0C3125
MSPFSSLIGQPQAVKLLTQAIAKQRVAPAYLFAGPAGVGRSLAAECFIADLFSQTASMSKEPAILQQRIRDRNHPDLLWVEPTYLHQGKRLSTAEAIVAGVKRKAAPLIRLEQIREIAQFLGRPPLEASRSVVVIEQAETMAEAPANALLKTLEEPGRATLILIAPGVESLLPTLVSRCQRIPFYRLAREAMAQVLQDAGYGEIGQHPQILQLADGSPGAAIAHWQQLQALPADLLQQITQRPRSHREALTLARQINQLIEPEMQLWLIDYLQHHYWQQTQQRPWENSQLQPLQLLEKAREYLRSNVQPRLVWEVTLLGMVA